MQSRTDREQSSNLPIGKGKLAAERRRPSKRRDSSQSAKQMSGAATRSRGALARCSMSERGKELAAKRAAVNLEFNDPEDEEDDILLHSNDEYNQGQYEADDNKQPEAESRGLFTRQKNEKSLSLHDPNINREFQRRLSEQIGQTFSPDSRLKQLNTLQSQKFN